MQPPNARPRALEAPIHRAILTWLRLVLPKDSLVVHVANEVDAKGEAIAKAIAKAKSLGMCPGFPDLALFLPDGRVAMLEVKAPGNSLTATQTALHHHLRKAGHLVATVKSIDEAAAALKGWGIAIRGQA